MMNGNAELLNFVYQNAQMGADTIEQLIEIVEDTSLSQQLHKQLGTYEEVRNAARKMLNANGYDEKGLSALEKIRTYLMINLQTLTDRSTSHIAEMLIIGSNMGVIQTIKKLKQYDAAAVEIIALMDYLRKFEEENIEVLKHYL